MLKLKFHKLVKTSIIAGFAAIISIGALSSAAKAADPVRLGEYGAWDAYEYMENGSKVCYMASRPTARSEELNRGDIYAMIVHRPAEGVTNEVLFRSGYPHRAGSTVRITVGNSNWTFDTEDEIAFTLNRQDELAVVEAVKSGSRLQARGVSGRGNTTNDTYSLRGTMAAYESISEACSVE